MRLPPAGPFLKKPLLQPSRLKMTTPQLPPLPEVERLSPGCIRILAGNPGKFTLQGTNTYLVGTSSARILIDTGEGRPSWIAALQRVLRDERAAVAYTLITHRHHDHTGGIPDLLRAWPGMRVYKHQPEEGQLELADGMQFRVEGASLRAVHTPGHTADHMSLHFLEENALFTGDNVLGHGTSVFEDLATYVASLERMRHLFVSGDDDGTTTTITTSNTGRAYPGHGAVVEDGPGKIAEYIRHRGQREEQVVQTLRSGGAEVEAAAAAGVDGNGKGDAWTVMELVRSIYRDVPESLHPAAAGGVVQILQKLQREGRAVAVDDGERWRLASGRSAL
ncbi:beta-lactamase-like protein [Parachaetomium inaequale]|uniref:Beta-lactamase-like protein n=1 Tax=Parachaetomium inaequale TaxID=2588326 RepID=A0AAN6PA09_9PEZI|nr:beta-lactamase-like protein [Parachaetomium inaequale]